MQLPQSMFRIRTNAGVLCKTTYSPELVIYFAGEHEWMFSTKSVALFVSKLKFKERKEEKKKVLKCCPRFPLRRQNKEATWSTPRTAPANINIGLFIRGNNVLTALYEEAIAFYVISPHICRGVVLFVSVFIRLLLG